MSNSGGALNNGQWCPRKVGGPKRLYLLIVNKSGGAEAPLAPPVLPSLSAMFAQHFLVCLRL